MSLPTLLLRKPLSLDTHAELEPVLHNLHHDPVTAADEIRVHGAGEVVDE